MPNINKTGLIQATTNAPNTILDAEMTAGVNWTITANIGYTFTTAPRIRVVGMDMMPKDYYFVLSTDKKSGVYNGILKIGDVTITGEAFEDTAPMVDVSTNGLQNCTTDAPSQVELSEALAGVNWTVTSDAGYKFNVLSPPRITAVRDGMPTFYDMLIDSTEKIATYSGVLKVNASGYISISGVAIEDVPEFKEYGSINPYVVSEDNLNEFANARFIYPDPMGEGADLIDLGDFVHSIKRTYYELEKAGNVDLWAGSTNTEIQVEALANDETLLTFNNVLVPTKNNNSTDLESEIKLFLPFVGFTTILSEYIGTLIKVTYRINLINSIAIVNIYSNDNLIDVLDCNPFKDVIYRKNDVFEGSFGTTNSDATYLYGLKPYIELKWFTSNSEALYSADLQRDTINTFTGWNKFEDLDGLDNDVITVTELRELKQILNSGVLIV